MNKIYFLVNEYIDETQQDFNVLDTKEDDDEYDEDLNESWISIYEKLKRFKDNSDIYIENIINNKLKHGLIKPNDIKMIKKAMETWFNRIFYSIEKALEISEYEYKYNNKNISRFL